MLIEHKTDGKTIFAVCGCRKTRISTGGDWYTTDTTGGVWGDGTSFFGGTLPRQSKVVCRECGERFTISADGDIQRHPGAIPNTRGKTVTSATEDIEQRGWEGQWVCRPVDEWVAEERPQYEYDTFSARGGIIRMKLNEMAAEGWRCIHVSKLWPNAEDLRFVMEREKRD